MLLLPVVSACAAEMVYTDGAVDISGLRSGGKLIQVSYDENGMLKGVKLLEAVNGTNARGSFKRRQVLSLGRCERA